MKVKRPTLLVDQQKVQRNISRIATKAKASTTELWPHFKTHQSLEIGRWFMDYGIKGLTVSSVSMAQYFARAGWQNIYIAFPLNINEIEEIDELSSRVSLTVLVNEEIQLLKLFEKVQHKVKVKLEIETGASRSGIRPEDEHIINHLLQLINDSQHDFGGFYSHFGHTYKAQGASDVLEIFETSYRHLVSLQAKFTDYQPTISLGDTPSASVLPDYKSIASIHAGNYVFYDLTQAQIGVCTEDDIGIVLATPIVSKNDVTRELVVYGGGIHLSKENMLSKEFKTNIFGKIVALLDEGWSASLEGCYVSSISQEHGIIKVTNEVFEQFKVGDSIGILPVHSCMTADCMGGYLSTFGDKIDHLQGNQVSTFNK